MSPIHACCESTPAPKIASTIGKSRVLIFAGARASVRPNPPSLRSSPALFSCIVFIMAALTTSVFAGVGKAAIAQPRAPTSVRVCWRRGWLEPGVCCGDVEYQPTAIYHVQALGRSFGLRCQVRAPRLYATCVRSSLETEKKVGARLESTLDHEAQALLSGVVLMPEMPVNPAGRPHHPGLPGVLQPQVHHRVPMAQHPPPCRGWPVQLCSRDPQADLGQVRGRHGARGSRGVVVCGLYRGVPPLTILSDMVMCGFASPECLRCMVAPSLCTVTFGLTIDSSAV